MGWLTKRKFALVSWPNNPNRKRVETIKKFNKIRNNIKDNIFKLTSFLPNNFKLSYRLKILECNMIEEDCRCPVKSCSGWRQKISEKDREGNRISFKTTCSLKDKDHMEYVRKERKNKLHIFLKSNPRKQTKINVIKTQNNNLDKYGIGNVAQTHYNIENYSMINKQYLEDHFLDKNGCVLLENMMLFINCSKTTCFNIFRRFQVNYLRRPKGFNPNLPTYLYYIKDNLTSFYKIGITNYNVTERFTSKSLIITELKTWYFKSGLNAYKVEQALHKHFKDYQIYNENFVGDGATEFFKIDILNLDKSG